MKIVILHHHMNPGGVTRVIQSQVESLCKSDVAKNILLISGSSVPDLPGIDVVTHPAFNYLAESEDFDAVLESIVKILKRQLKKEDILHIHNPNLGKNPVLTFALYRLASSGHRIVCHIHDFAEDRPANLRFLQKVICDHFGADLAEVMYPQHRNVSYATLSSADLTRLVDLGVGRQKIHLLPNPIKMPEKIARDAAEIRSGIVGRLGLDPEKLIVTYPVRVIRRKNIGEFVLLSVLGNDKANWLVTQPPLNPVEIEHYKKWLSFCKDLKLPVVFEAGLKVPFEELLFASDFCITTSLREGFGMAYLEPWMFDTPVVGRNLKQVTDDFQKEGLLFPNLYDQLLVPYQGRQVDFAELEEQQQREIIKKALGSAEYSHKILLLNPQLENIFDCCDRNTVEANKKIIEKRYSLERYGHELEAIYQTLSR